MAKVNFYYVITGATKKLVLDQKWYDFFSSLLVKVKSDITYFSATVFGKNE